MKRRVRKPVTAHALKIRAGIERSKQQRATFRALCIAQGVVPPVSEYRFALDIEREWPFDYAWPVERVALEVHGGLFVNGGHNRGAYMLKEFEKRNEAAARGWVILYTQPGGVKYSGLLTLDTIRMVRRALDTARSLKGLTR